MGWSSTQSKSSWTRGLLGSHQIDCGTYTGFFEKNVFCEAGNFSHTSLAHHPIPTMENHTKRSKRLYALSLHNNELPIEQVFVVAPHSGYPNRYYVHNPGNRDLDCIKGSFSASALINTSMFIGLRGESAIAAKINQSVSFDVGRPNFDPYDFLWNARLTGTNLSNIPLKLEVKTLEYETAKRHGIVRIRGAHYRPRLQNYEKVPLYSDVYVFCSASRHLA